MRAQILVPQSSTFLDARTPLLTYQVPETLAQAITIGQMVSVPFGSRSAAGLVWATSSSDDAQSGQDAEPTALRLRSVMSVLSGEALVLPVHLALAEWIADRYA